MPKDALVDNLIGMCATRCGHCTPCVAAQRLVAFDVRCEALTAERDQLLRYCSECGLTYQGFLNDPEGTAICRDSYGHSWQVDEPRLDRELRELRSRCQHLEQENQQLRAAHQADQERFDRDLSNFAAGYSQAVTDATQVKP